jgi:hypothetical protein
LLLLGEDALLDLLDLALAATGLRLELRARLEGGFLGFEICRAPQGIGITAGIIDDAPGALSRLP